MSGCRGAAKIVKSGDRTNAAIIHVGHSDRSANNASQNDGCRSIRTNSSCKVAGFLPAGSPLAGQPVAAAQARWDLGSLPEHSKTDSPASFKSSHSLASAVTVIINKTIVIFLEMQPIVFLFGSAVQVRIMMRRANLPLTPVIIVLSPSLLMI